MNQVPALEFANEIDNLALRVRAAMVSHAVGKIDYAEVDSIQIVPGARSTPDGKAIAFDWGLRNPRTVTRQLGYLTGTKDVTSKYQASLNNTVSLQVMGVGNGMRSNKSRAWSNATIAEVLTDVLSEHRVNLVMDAHTTRWTRIVQPNESDWSLICRLAKKIGFWPYLHHTTLYVLNPDTLATRQAPTVVVPSQSLQMEQRTNDLPQTGEAIVSARTGTFVDQLSGVVHEIASAARVAVASGQRPSTGRTDNMALEQSTHAEATAVLEGVDRNAAWYIEKTVEIDGRSDLKPLMPVVIPNPRVKRPHYADIGQGWEQYDGVWLVKCVDTTMKFHYDNFGYRTTLTVVRDSRGPLLNVRQRRADTLSFSNQPATRLLDGAWVSAWRNN